MVSLTEEQIERAVERMIDRLDATYMAHKITHEEYDATMKIITEWADKEYRFRRREP